MTTSVRASKILKEKDIEVLIVLGAGDIDNYVPEIQKILEMKNNVNQ